MDSFEINKIAGAVLGTLTLTLGLVIAADGLLSSHAPEKAGYELPGLPEQSDAGPAVAEAVEPIAVRLAVADAAKGEAIARRCGSCHDFTDGGPNKVGPNLYNIINADKAHISGFAYSTAMKEAEGAWTYENLDGFLDNPRGYLPGTSMSFAGIKKPDERANLIAYLRTLSASPAPLPDAPAAEEQPAEAQPEAPSENTPGDAATPPAENTEQPPPANP